MDENTTIFNQTMLCEFTRNTLTPSYRVMLAVECVMGLLAIPPNVLFLSVIWHVGIFTPALRILLAHLNVVLLWYCTGAIVRSLHGSFAPECGYNIRMGGCKIFEVMTAGLAVPSIVFSFLALCLHRLYANLRYKVYEKKAITWFPCVLIACVWTGSIALQIPDLIDLSWDQYVPICATSFISSRNAWMTFYAKVGCELFAVFIGLFIYFYTMYLSNNASINKAKYDLSSRFQICENRRLNATLIPAMVLHFVCHIPNFILLSGVFGLWDMTYAQKPWLSRFSYLVLLIFALGQPILAFRSNDHLKKELMKTNLGMRLEKMGRIMCWGSAGQKTPVVPISVQVTHFNYLDNIWDRARIKRQVNKKGKEMAI